jgi:CubicO group peptidase (beta-lactamase class C family)
MTDFHPKGFDRFVQRCLKDWSVPGCAIGVVRRNRTLSTRGFGLRDLKNGLQVTETTAFRIGSCTKAFTATAIGILVGEGKLEWDTPVREYVPSFRMKDPVATERTTLRDILAHRTGLSQHSDVWFGSSLAREQLLKKLPRLEPVREFRTGFEYSGLLYAVAGLVIERVTGKTWEEFTQQRLFDPLGMSRSYCLDRNQWRNTADQSADEVAVGYIKKGKRMVPYFHGSKKRSSAAEELGPIGPAGAIVSTVDDMCRWLAFQMGEGRSGGREIISKNTLREVHTPQIPEPGHAPFPELLDVSYAMGWRVQPYRGLRSVWHGGQCCGMTANVSFLPGEKIGVVVLTNSVAHPLWRILPFVVYDRLLELRPIRWNARFSNRIKGAEKKRKK